MNLIARPQRWKPEDLDLRKDVEARQRVVDRGASAEAVRLDRLLAWLVSREIERDESGKRSARKQPVANRRGRWFAIDRVVGMQCEIERSHALHHTETAQWTDRVVTVDGELAYGRMRELRQHEVTSHFEAAQPRRRRDQAHARFRADEL